MQILTVITDKGDPSVPFVSVWIVFTFTVTVIIHPDLTG